MARRHRRRLRFFGHVYEVVQLVPYGRVATYGQVASIVGDSQAARTVGWALNRLPQGKHVPWHRVINAQGQISTRRDESAAQDQRVLLEREGVVFDGRGCVDLRRYQWEGLDWPEIEALHRAWQNEPPGDITGLGE